MGSSSDLSGKRILTARGAALISATALVLAGVSFARSSSAAPDAGAPSATKVAGPPDVKWDDMTKEQRGKYMKAVVVPKMKPLFQEFDPALFKKFDCATCHGKDAKERKFKMPNPELHPLPSTPEAFGAMMKTKPTWPKWTKFMGEKVEPTMAALLGTHPFDPKKPAAGGFGCIGCHTLDKK